MAQEVKNVTVGKKIRQLRFQNKDKLTDLADYLGIDAGNLSKIENGKRKLSLELIDKIAEKYHLKPEERAFLLTESESSGEEVYRNMNPNVNPNSPQTQVNLPAGLPVLYSDVISVTASPYGLVFDFGQKMGPTNQVNIVARIGVSKEHGDALMKVLMGKLKDMQLLTKKTDKKND